MKQFFYKISILLFVVFNSAFVTAADEHKAFIPKTPEEALEILKKGNDDYRKLKVSKDGLRQEDRLRQVSGQHPHTIILSCSDSRVPPEIVFNQRLGDLFVVRTAGQALDDTVFGSIIYALEHLHSRLLIVLGHESCGAVDAAVKIPANTSSEDEAANSIEKILAKIRPNIAGVRLSDTRLNESAANANGVVKSLLDNPVIFKHVESKELIIKSALYHLGTGVVEFDPQVK
jgi:carbonic anhydrase